MAGEMPAWLGRHPRASYIIAAALSCPPWADRKAFRRLIDKRNAMTKETGQEHVIDHIVPLNHPRVCGLSVPWNLQVIPRACNGAKNNYFEPDQLELL